MRRLAVMAACMVLAASANAAPRNEKIHAAVDANHAGALDLLREIVNIDSGTGDIEGGNKVAAILAARLTAIGAQVRREPTEVPGLPDNLVAVWHGTGKGRILIIAHLDTVFGPGTASARPFRMEEGRMDAGRAYGPGVGDEKGGVVLAVTALKILHDTGFRDYATITLMIDNSEERGSTGSTALIKKLAVQHDVEFNMEPGDAPDVLTVWRKGSASVRLVVKGRAAHAGMAPQDGRNAALELVHQVTALDGAFPKSGDGTTVNLTLMTGGSRANIIPDTAEATYSVRYRKPEDYAAVIAKMQDTARTVQIPDTVVTVVPPTTGFPPLIQNDRITALANRANAIYAEIGKTAVLGGNGGASESATVMSVGTVALDGLGPVMGDAHNDKEWIDLNSVAPRLYLITRLLMETGKNPPTK
jgi:glutamate carboxypeptidase